MNLIYELTLVLIIYLTSYPAIISDTLAAMEEPTINTISINDYEVERMPLPHGRAEVATFERGTTCRCHRPREAPQKST